MSKLNERLVTLVRRFAPVLAISLLSLPAFADPTAVVSGRILTVLIDVDHCAQTSTLCSGSGSVGPAADGNDSIVAVYVHVQNGITPLTGLAEGDFSTVSVTNSGLGNTPVFVGTATCPACFAEPEPGVYRLAMRPSSSALWGGGTYVTLLAVTLPNGVVLNAMMPIDIPF